MYNTDKYLPTYEVNGRTVIEDDSYARMRDKKVNDLNKVIDYG